MVFSNEPGIYRPGIDGYRTINTMIVTEDAAEIPSQFLATHEIDVRILKLQPAG
jgi:Xaa-Pro aminopeptidase